MHCWKVVPNPFQSKHFGIFKKNLYSHYDINICSVFFDWGEHRSYTEAGHVSGPFLNIEYFMVASDIYFGCQMLTDLHLKSGLVITRSILEGRVSPSSK